LRANLLPEHDSHGARIRFHGPYGLSRGTRLGLPDSVRSCAMEAVVVTGR
jgi:hypothetical protein